MKRTLIIKSIKQIKEGKTFHRSCISKTLYNKKLWDELKSEITDGYSIDVPSRKSQCLHRV